MKHIGIIAEYNPFHNGHQYQLKKVRKLFPKKDILIVMSGDYVQRGEPAIFNKYLRTQCALQSGADIVFELPALFATASAEYFATASVLALSATGAVDTLCFGAESENIKAFQKIAGLFAEEPKDYQQLLKQYLKNGLSYPKARSQAAAIYLQDDTCSDLLKQPNNILGIEYIKAIQKYHLNITPVIIKRKGSGYHDLSTKHPMCSASALRKMLADGNTDLHQFVPGPAWTAIEESPYGKPLFLSDFYPFLQYALWHNTSYDKYFEITKDLSNRLHSIQAYPPDIESLIEQLSGKNTTRTHLQRAFLNLILNRRSQSMEAAKSNNYISYIRLLGFRNSSTALLREMKTSCTVPIINKVANARKILSESTYTLFENDLHCSTLYQQTFFNKYQIQLPSEYEHSVIIEK